MKRRTFIRGAVAVAVSAAIPRIPGDGVALRSIEHPGWVTKVAEDEWLLHDGSKMARALARSMMQTREIVASNILNKAFRGGSHDNV